MLKVACAIIIKDQQVLIAQRSSAMKLPLKWEFPGGKIEAGETIEEGLKREIMEELNINILIRDALSAVEYHYPDFSLRLYPFMCTYLDGELEVREHAQAKWESLNNLRDYDWAEADVPVVNELLLGLFKI